MNSPGYTGSVKKWPKLGAPKLLLTDGGEGVTALLLGVRLDLVLPVHLELAPLGLVVHKLRRHLEHVTGPRKIHWT